MYTDKQMLTQLKHDLIRQPYENTTHYAGRVESIQATARKHLKAIGYGIKRDYKKIVVGGWPTVTTWAKSEAVAKIAWIEKKGYVPTTERY